MPINIGSNVESSMDEVAWQQRLSRLNEKEKIKEVSQEFESIFNEILLKSMRDTVQKSELVDGGNAEKIYQSMLDREYATQIAKTSRFGLASQIENQLLSKLEGQKEPAPNDSKVAGQAAYKSSSLALQKKTGQN